MDVTPLVKEGAQVIQSYAGGSFRVSGESYTGPVIVFPTYTTEWHYVKSNKKEGDPFSCLEEGSFEALLGEAENIDVVLLGCGPTIQFLDPKLKNTLKDKGLSIEVMDTGAACRTYNVLMAEGRRVVAALLPV